MEVLNIGIYAGLHNFFRHGAGLNFRNGGIGFVLERFIHLKEVLDFFKPVRGQFVYIVIETVIRVVYGHGDYLFVSHAAVFHNQHADGNALNYCHRSYDFTAKYQHIQRVAVCRVSAGDKAVVCGIVS